MLEWFLVSDIEIHHQLKKMQKEEEKWKNMFKRITAAYVNKEWNI